MATPEKASRMMVARCTRRLATVVAVLNLRSAFSCRSLITTFAAEPAMATLLVFPHPGKSAESSKAPHPVPGRFRFPGLVGQEPGQCLALSQRALAEVRQLLDGAWRASSLVECINSVARMQQSRHRRMTQELLDLRRLYWNCRALRTGPRRKRTPQELLGIKLLTTDWWELLKMTPEQLRQQLSAPELQVGGP